MGQKFYDESDIQNIANAIRSKNGTQNTYTVAQMAGAVGNIPTGITPSGSVTLTSNGTYDVTDKASAVVAVPTGSPTVSNPALVLWDWEGTKLAEYSAEDALALTELPAPSTFPAYETADHELLLFQSWNWSLANIKTWIQNHEGKYLDVGAIYTTTDRQDHNYWGNPRLNTATTIIMQKRGTVSIGNNAFQNYYSLTYINIPDGVMSIGNNAFQNCFSLTQINIPDGVTSIGSSAFSGCSSLTQINIPDGVTSIGSGAFYNCSSLTQINIPDGVTSIGNSAFQSCYSLTRINIPDSVTSIGNSAFQHCYSLTRINIPDGVTSIGSSAFNNCKTLCDVLLESKPTLANTNAFGNLPTNYRIYVPRSDLSWFETATNWPTIYTQGHIVAIEDYIDYLESIGFNVDKYKEAV